jgi:O-antigen/teichoic acid export membrane protein
MIGNLVVWAIILSGGGLWAVVGSTVARLGVEAYLVLYRYAPLLGDLTSTARVGPPKLSWETELLPLQWRIAVQSIAAYFLLQAYTPIIFKYHGAELGGRMGMTLSAISTVQLVALAWIQTRVPQIGRLISERRTDASRQLFLRVLRVCMGVYAIGSAAFLVLLLLLVHWLPWLASRMLDPWSVLLFQLAMGLTLLVSGLGTYVRAHKIDPFLKIGMFNATVTGLLIWWAGARLGPAGAAVAHIATTSVIMLPATCFIYRGTVRGGHGKGARP